MWRWSRCCEGSLETPAATLFKERCRCSSVWSERLPCKQLAGGSNPSFGSILTLAALGLLKMQHKAPARCELAGAKGSKLRWKSVRLKPGRLQVRLLWFPRPVPAANGHGTDGADGDSVMVSADLIVLCAHHLPQLRKRREMIKARYGLADEDLVDQVMEKISPVARENPDCRHMVSQVIMCLRHGLGYDISIEVEVHGDMAKALESLGGDTSNYVIRERPKRIHNEPATCGGGCPTD